MTAFKYLNGISIAAILTFQFQYISLQLNLLIFTTQAYPAHGY